LGLDDPVWCLDFDNAAALALIRHENQAAQRASNSDNRDGKWMNEPMLQPTPELIPGKPFVTVVQT
jgi:hypothetical protein